MSFQLHPTRVPSEKREQKKKWVKRIVLLDFGLEERLSFVPDDDECIILYSWAMSAKGVEMAKGAPRLLL